MLAAHSLYWFIVVRVVVETEEQGKLNRHNIFTALRHA